MKIKHYLVASETNDYRPWIITPAALAVFCVVIWGLRVMIPVSIGLAQNTINAADLMNKINEQRTQRFILALNTNSKLSVAATGKANDMLARSYFAHMDPDGEMVWTRIEAAGYTPYQMLGENLAMDFTTADGVVAAWMNSPTHRANLINEKFIDQGLASIAGSFEPDHDTIVVVSLFGTLFKSSPPATPPAPTPNPSPAPNPSPPTTPATGPNPTPPSPAPTPVIKNPPAATSALKISNDIRVTNTFLSGRTLIDVDVIIAGEPTLVTANIKGQSITMIKGKVAGQFVGRFTFDATEDLQNQTMHVEARDKNGSKASLDYPLNILPQSTDPIVGDAQTNIPVSNEARVFSILRIIFGIFATIYMGFLALDAIIIHRAKIKRPGIHPNPHLLVIALVAAVTLFSGLL